MITRRGFISGAGIAAAGLGAGLTAAREAAVALAQHSEASNMKITELETILIDNIDPPIGHPEDRRHVADRLQRVVPRFIEPPTGPGLGVELDMAVIERHRAA